MKTQPMQSGIPKHTVRILTTTEKAMKVFCLGIFLFSFFFFRSGSVPLMIAH